MGDLITELSSIASDLRAAEREQQRVFAQVHPSYRESARNLIHYLALRRRDIRTLQTRLTQTGLSSLGRSEANILSSVETLLALLHRLSGSPSAPPATATGAIVDGQSLLVTHTGALLGPSPKRRSTRIMLTMPSEAADDPTLIDGFVANGMDVMRINCAHDDAAAWTRMIDHLRTAERRTNRRCLISMDLAGPKLRTGPLPVGPEVVHWRPQRDALGHVIAPARVWLTVHDRVSDAPGKIDGVLPLPVDWLARLVPGDEVTFVDTRGRNRHLQVVTTAPDGCLAEARQTAYVISGTLLTIWRGGDSVSVADMAAVGTLPPREQSLALTIGDRLVLTRDLSACQWPMMGDDGSVVEPARIGCTLPEVFGAAKPGQPIWFDDGKIGGVIESTEVDELTVKITHAPASGARLRAGKGINLPETRLSLLAMTDKDIADLAFAARQADMVALSFVQTASDVESFYQSLRQLKPAERQIGLVLKIETRRAFANLPELVLAAMRGSSVGIMIARGDLAVECGFERLAEVQEEILWLSEAAHLPVIWATQVLETEAKTGQPTRAEITDAAMGQRAECVMLNKGPYIGDTLRTLDDILRRMTAHQSKKRPLLRRLRAWDGVSP